MNNSNTTTPPNTTGTAPTTNDPTAAIGINAGDPSLSILSTGGNPGDPQIVLPIEIRPYTSFITEAGTINVIHEISLGDLLLSTLVMALLTFTVISRVVRR